MATNDTSHESSPPLHELESASTAELSNGNGIPSPKSTILLIHGLWMTPSCWEDWGVYYTNVGYTVLAPGWPGVDDLSVEDI
jgi:pimeloyl-ACP methyl ester carboxylesterase